MYSELEELPFRGSMKRTRKHRCMWGKDGYGSKISHFFRWLDGFLRSSVGRPVNDIYSDLCHKYPNTVGWIDPREQFKDKVYENWRGSKYYVDDEGILRAKTHKRKNPRCIKRPISSAIKEYRFCSWKVNSPWYLLYVLHNRRAYEVVRDTGIMTPQQYLKLKHSQYWNQLKNAVDAVYDVKYEIIPKGTRLYSRLRAEEIQRNRRAYKKYWEEKKEIFEERAEWFLWKDKEYRNHCKKAQKEREKREELQNLIDRDRLGFDENSFMGSNYNSRKGRKLKRLIHA